MAIAVLFLAVSPVKAQTRDPFLWPFSATSIWNQSIGSGAQYHAVNLGPIPQNRTDWEYLSQTVAGDPQNTCNSWGVALSLSMKDADPVFTMAGDDRSTNGVVAIVQPDGWVYQGAGERPAAGGPLNAGACGWSWYNTFSRTTLLQDGYYGAHWGSHLSVLGGSIRAWELAQSTNEYAIQHAIKIELDQNLLWLNPADSTKSYVWPATVNDASTAGYGIAKNDPALAMGSLLAIPPSVSESSLGLQTMVGKQVFHALQDYGAYIVDTSGVGYTSGGKYIYSFTEDRAARDVFDMDTTGPFLSDLSSLVQNLYVVSNNGPASIGGGGTPRRSPPPAFAIPVVYGGAPAPTNLGATPGNQQIALTWNASTGATSYTVYRGVSSGGESSTAIASGISQGSYTDSAVEAGVTYYYEVTAVNAVGGSLESNEASAKLTVATPPAPTDLVATAGN